MDKHKKKPIVLFFIVYAIYMMATSFAHPVTPSLIKDRGFADYMFGIAYASMMISNFLFSPMWGKLCNYISAKYILFINALGYLISQVIFLLAFDNITLIIARLLAGVFIGGVATAVLNYVINISSDEQRALNLTIIATIFSVSSAAGYFIGGMLGVISIAASFIAQCILLGVVAILFMIVCEKDMENKLKTLSPTSFIKEANPFTIMFSARKFMTPLLAILFISVTLGSLGQNTFDQSFNYYLRDRLGLSSAYNGIFKAMVAIVSLVTNAAIGIRLMRKTDIRNSIIPVTALSCVSMIAIIFCDTLVPFVIANLLFFALNAIRLPMLQSISAKKARGKDSNVIMGFYNSVTSLGGVFGGLASGFVYPLWSKAPFLVAAIAFALSTVLAISYYKGDVKENPFF